MSGTLLALGIVFQLGFAGFQAMLAIFGGAALHNNRELTTLQSAILTHAIWVLPAVSIAVICILAYLFAGKSPLLSHKWHLLPFITSGLFLLYASRL